MMLMDTISFFLFLVNKKLLKDVKNKPNESIMFLNRISGNG